MAETNTQFIKQFSREMMRSMFQSMFLSVFNDRKKRHKMTQQQLANSLGINKAVISRNLNSPPNWTIDKISDMAEALDVEIQIMARDRKTGIVHTAAGPVFVPASSTHNTIVSANGRKELAVDGLAIQPRRVIGEPAKIRIHT